MHKSRSARLGNDDSRPAPPKAGSAGLASLLKHTMHYFVARGIPGLFNFAALALYTRLLAPDEFGRYATVIATVTLIQVGVFQWLNLVVGRYLQAQREDLEEFLAGIMALFILLAVTASGVGLFVVLLWDDPVWRGLIAISIPLLLLQAWFELSASIARAELAPRPYGRMTVSKTTLALMLGGLLAWLGLGAYAPLTGLIAGHGIAIIAFGMALWQGTRPRWPQATVLRAHLRYGLPLTATFALTWIINSSDRLMLSWLSDDTAVGVYAAGYDLARQSLMLLLTIVDTAAFPLVVRAFDQGGRDAARHQLIISGSVIIALALTGAAGMIALTPQLVDVLIGEQFRSGARLVMPWIALATALASIKMFHFDIAFHLATQSQWLVAINGLAAIVNVGANFILIPSHGLLGAAWAAVLAYFIAATGSAWVGRRIFNMPRVWPIFARGLFIAVPVAGFTWIGGQLPGNQWGLLSGLVIGVVAACVFFLLTNLAGSREWILQIIRRHIHNHKLRS